MDRRSRYVRHNLDKALANGWIEIFFQPVVRSLTGEVCSFEVLARWRDPEYGLLPPAVFIGVLEQARLIHKLDAYIVREACKAWVRESGQHGVMAPLSVNLSRLDFELCDAFELVDSAVREFNVPRQMLHVEVTESALNDNEDLLASEVERFRNQGYQVWLDDFGSGYSSLNTLKDYTFDVVKIDMAFLREFDSKPKSRVIIASIVNMAKQLGMQTLIEGVETPEQFDYVRSIGCELVQGFLVGAPLPELETLRRFETGELVLARTAHYAYYDRLGAVNTLSATPFEFPWEMAEKERPFAEMLPLAIVECEGGESRFVFANDGFVEVLREIGIGSMAEAADQVNRRAKGQAHIVADALATAVFSGDIESVDLLVNGNHCMLRVRHVASHGEVDALLVSFINLSRFSNVSEDKRLGIALRYLYAVYEEVNIVDLADGSVHTIYRGNSAFPEVAKDVNIKDAAEGFALRFVHPSDRERCVRYLDLSTINERIEASGRNYLAEGFRTLKPDGTYGWLVSVLVPVVIDGAETVLVCVRQANEEVLWSLAQEDEIPKALLWDTLVDLVPAGVFWKDRDRRFLGVNKNFLQFYEFSSTNEVLGLTDEDMGWHVDVDPFRDNELTVIEKGEPVLNARGSCIARGEVRDILASKIPLRRNGEVIGLLGYFTDLKESPHAYSSMLNGFDRMASTDQLTNIPNTRGLSASAVAYQMAFKAGGPDCIYTVLDIKGMHDFNRLYGRSFGNRVLKVIADALVRSCGVSGVVARIGGDKFCVLRQVTPGRDASLEAEFEGARLRDLVAAITDVDGVRIRLTCFVGWSLLSECEDADAALALAEDRMHESRGRS